MTLRTAAYHSKMKVCTIIATGSVRYENKTYANKTKRNMTATPVEPITTAKACSAQFFNKHYGPLHWGDIQKAPTLRLLQPWFKLTQRLHKICTSTRFVTGWTRSAVHVLALIPWTVFFCASIARKSRHLENVSKHSREDHVHDTSPVPVFFYRRQVL